MTIVSETRYGLPVQTVDKICGVLAQFSSVERAILYGSRATGTYRPGSDIDLSLCGADDLTAVECARIASALDDLLLPYTIDLSVFDQITHAKLRVCIERDGIVFYQRASRQQQWPVVRLGDVCDFRGGSQPPKSQFVYEPQEGYIRFIQIRDFKSDKNLTYIPVSKKNRICKSDDILIARYGASVGQILSGLDGAYNVALMKIIPNVNCVTKGWLYAYLLSNLFQNPLKEVSSRSAQNGFNKEDISMFDLPLPPLNEQQRIVAKLDAAFAQADRIIAAAEQQLQQYAALKQAILTDCLSPQ